MIWNNASVSGIFVFEIVSLPFGCFYLLRSFPSLLRTRCCDTVSKTTAYQPMFKLCKNLTKLYSVVGSAVNGEQTTIPNQHTDEAELHD